MTRKFKVMFLCSGNSCRSQMAEGFARHLGSDILEAHSAGLEPCGINPRAIQVMNEVGVDISTQSSKPIDGELLRQMDYIITLCGNAEERCPVTPQGVIRIHWPLEDPAKATGTGDAVLAKFRSVREQIRERVKELIQELRAPGDS